jgi:DNA processing protein
VDRARALAADLAGRGAVVVSGGAIGIDAAAHEGAVGRTVAVLASGLDRPYPPRNAPLFAEIVAAGGALASPFPEGTPVRRWQFLHRNEIIAALAEAVVVVEAGARSGSLHTARAAARLHKVVGACPGSPGTEALIATGAALIENGDDVVAALAGTPRRPERRTPSAGDEAAAWGVLEDPADADTVAARAGIPVLRAARALTALELDGLATALPGGRWVRA